MLEPLEKFALDVVVVAPTCADLLALMDVPSLWNDAAKKISGALLTMTRKENVFIEVKLVDVLSAILSKSWVGMRPGWLTSASFVHCNWADLTEAIL